MYRDLKPPKRDINLAFVQGGLGDAIAAFPVIKYITEKHDNHEFTLYVPSYMKDLVVLTFPELTVYCPKDKKGKKGYLFSNQNGHVNAYLRTHLTDVASILFCGEILPEDKKDYLKPDLSSVKCDIGGNGKYAVITTMFTSKTRSFPDKEINKIVDYLLSKSIIPVFLGKEGVFGSSSNDGINYDKGINLVNKTSLVQALKIMSEAEAVLGVDNGLLHLACMSDVPVIGGYTTVKPEHRLPYRRGKKGWNYHSVLPDSDLGCRFCQSNWVVDGIEHDFRNCFYNDFKCCDQMTANKFIYHLQRIL